MVNSVVKSSMENNALFCYNDRQCNDALSFYQGGFMGLFERVKSVFQSAEEKAPARKPERNEPCWCGSGKKYKKCHFLEDDKKVAAKTCSLSCGPT
jgi:SEC-C motif